MVYNFSFINMHGQSNDKPKRKVIYISKKKKKLKKSDINILVLNP